MIKVSSFFSQWLYLENSFFIGGNFILILHYFLQAIPILSVIEDIPNHWRNPHYYYPSSPTLRPQMIYFSLNFVFCLPEQMNFNAMSLYWMQISIDQAIITLLTYWISCCHFAWDYTLSCLIAILAWIDDISLFDCLLQHSINRSP